MSACLLHLGTDLDVASLLEAQITIVAPYSSEESYERSVRGSIGSVSVTAPTLTDPDRAPVGQHTVVVSAAVPIECGERPDWDDRKVADEMLAMAERALPGLSSRITFAAGQIARTICGLATSARSMVGRSSRNRRPPIAYRMRHRLPGCGSAGIGHSLQAASGAWSRLGFRPQDSCSTETFTVG